MTSTLSDFTYQGPRLEGDIAAISRISRSCTQEDATRSSSTLGVLGICHTVRTAHHDICHINCPALALLHRVHRTAVMTCEPGDTFKSNSRRKCGYPEQLRKKFVITEDARKTFRQHSPHPVPLLRFPYCIESPPRMMISRFEGRKA